MLGIEEVKMRANAVVQAIGPEAALKFSQLFGGTRQDIPNPDAVMRAVTRNAAIWEDLCSGKAYSVVALQYRLTVRQVRNIEHMMRDSRKVVK